MPRFYPMMLDLLGKRCVVVGGGEVAARKAESLAECGAKVTVIAPAIDPSLKPLIDGGAVTHFPRSYGAGDLQGAALAIASTDNEAVNRSVYADANALGIPVNVVDVPELCTFIVPAVVEQGDLTIAISTSGKSPAMAKRIRKEMEGHFGPEYGVMLRLLGEVRQLAQAREKDIDRRMKLMTAIVNSDLLERLRGGARPAAEEVYKEFAK
ncbi:MAG: bifunctional precorrin-2 dehydrogenase/sirohydrochlorin ferrochelatase [Nitrospinae bacterium]|nr:bifunctional precorrin-2 dehydrogenase/sirohydrochlorin ferrochelatase [Nitrospinota bacterium]